MSFQQDIFSLIANLTGNENVLAVPKDFLKFAGDANTGIFLAQLIYWCDKGKRKDGYIYKTTKEWKEELGLNEYRIRKARNTLEDMGILETKVKKANGNPTVHYKINRKAFVDAFLDYHKKEYGINTNGNCDIPNSLTEITTESTSETSSNTYIAPKKSSEAMRIYLNLYEEHAGEEHKSIEENTLSDVSQLLNEIYEEVEKDKFTSKLTAYFDEFDYDFEKGRLPTLNYFNRVAGRYFFEECNHLFYDRTFGDNRDRRDNEEIPF